jgi:hypothetical protein
MKNYRVYLVLLVVVMAVVGALLHPLSLLLGLAPFNARAEVGFLVEVRSLIADLLGWGVLSLLAVMVVYAIRGRLDHGSRASAVAPTSPDAAVPDSSMPKQPGVVVAHLPLITTPRPLLRMSRTFAASPASSRSS